MKNNPRHVCEARYSPKENNVIVYRQHNVRKEFWDRYSVEDYPTLKEHTDKTCGYVYACSKCNDFLPVKDLMMWQECPSRWSAHTAICHPDCDFYVSPGGKMFMKTPAQTRVWWPVNHGDLHYDGILNVIKILSKSLPSFCLPDLDGNIFTVTKHNLIGCMKCGYSYHKQVKSGNNGWEK